MAKSFLSGMFGGKRPEGRGPAEAARPQTEGPDGAAPKGFLSRLAEGLTKSSARISEGVAAVFTRKKLDQETLDRLEEVLIAADLGAGAAGRVTAALARSRFGQDATETEARAALAEIVEGTLAPLERPLIVDRAKKPFVILMTGVNGAGKTTTIGKLAARFRAEGMTAMLAAGDTFRAAAIDQLKIWGERVGAEVIARPPGADAAGLAFEALERAKAAGADVLLVDTAGRLQNRKELMDELAKMARVLKKLDPEAPHATLLTLDATVGQNAILQAEAFREIAGVTGLVMTKLDGTARGGILVALGEKFGLPIHFIGVGERVEDLEPFRARAFARALAGLPQSEAAR